MGQKQPTESSAKATDYEEYMARVGSETIPAYEPSLGHQELEFVTDVVQRNWFSEGKYTREFEERLAKISGRAHALAFCNATSALITGMKSLGIGAGDEVIVPSFTHPADPNSIAATGATPAFADVDASSMVLSLRTIDEAKTKRTRAILYVSLYGNASELEEIVAYSRENHLALINDCAAALFGTYQRKAIASYGEFSVLSFFADKTITTGEGGMLLADDPSLIAECNIYKHDGRRERGHDLIERRGYNFRITELQAAIGVAQLNRIEELVGKKRENQQLYERLLRAVPEVRMFQFDPRGEPVPHRNIVMVPEAKPLIEHLVSLGIGVRSMFMPMHSQPCYDTGQRFPATEELYRTGVCLPSAPTLKREDIEFVCDAIQRYYQ